MKNHEMLRMFRYPSMIKSAAFCAAVFAMLSVLFKNSIVIVPEATEVRLCNVLTVCFAVWFGPAGAIGCFLGNLVGDLGGSLTALSYGGCFANFLPAWLAYIVWDALGAATGDYGARPSLKTKGWLRRYLLAGFVCVISCCAILGWDFDLMHAMPCANIAATIFLNNIAAAVLGIALYALMAALPQKILPYWREQMTEEQDMAYPPERKKTAVFLSLFSLGFALFFAVYMAVNGLSLRVSDGYGRVLPDAVCIAATLIYLLAALRCRWEKRESRNFFKKQ